MVVVANRILRLMTAPKGNPVLCWACHNVGDVRPDPHMPGVGFCRECLDRFNRPPQTFEDLAAGD